MIDIPKEIMQINRENAEKYKRDCETTIRDAEGIMRTEQRRPNGDRGVIAHCHGIINTQRIRIAMTEMELSLMDCIFDDSVLHLYEKSLAAIAALSCAAAKNLQEAAATAVKRGDDG